MTDVLVKILAVVGGGVGGGLGMGLLAQLLMRTAAIRTPPRWSVQTVRLLGGGICGWLVALWLFGGGGSGIGGTGGLGLGVGADKGEIGNLVENGKKNGGSSETSTGQMLRIEVLGRDALSDADIDAERWYRIETAQGPRLLTFTEIKEAVEKRQRERPELQRIEIVLYKDSPDERVLIVSQLRAWTGDRKDGKMKVDISRPDSAAPRK